MVKPLLFGHRKKAAPVLLTDTEEARKVLVQWLEQELWWTISVGDPCKIEREDVSTLCMVSQLDGFLL